MRAEERYWVKVSLTIGFVVLTLLLLVILGLATDLNHIFRSILETVAS